MTKQVYLESFGCQMNVLDAEMLMGNLAKEGYVLSDEKESADVLLFNTCSVRDRAEQRVNSIVGSLQHLKRRRPDVVIGVIGCMAQREGDAIRRRLPHVDLVAGPQQLRQIPALLAAVLDDRRPRISTDQPGDDFFIDPIHYAPLRQIPFQAYVKAMEGCNCACTFCIVPTTRGPEVSRPVDAILEECRRLAGEGVVDVCLLGQTVNAYGKGLGTGVTLATLLERIHEIPGIGRIRFITSHPLFNTEPIFRAMGGLPKVSGYLHIPAQSGSDRILKAMRRGYTVARYREIAARFRELVPHGEIASDFIVGFPTETEEDFEATVRLVRETGFQGSFIFKYSPRPGTDAHALPDDVPAAVKEERNRILLEVQNEVSLERNRAKAGRVLEVLVEGPSRHRPDRQTGRSGTHQTVVFEHPEDLRGRFVPVRVTGATALTLLGEVVPSECPDVRASERLSVGESEGHGAALTNSAP